MSQSISKTAPPRKRRRRTAVTGAADDCFTCAKRGTQCDRRRPYCSQCIELGQECSGYKTTLTWGVGVASRGKLRGLSLPVKGSRPAVSLPKVQRRADTAQLSQLTKSYLPSTEIGNCQPVSPTGMAISISQDQAQSLDASVNMDPVLAMNTPPPYSDTPVHSSHGADLTAVANIYKENSRPSMMYNEAIPYLHAKEKAHYLPGANTETGYTESWQALYHASAVEQQWTSKTRRHASEEILADRSSYDEECRADPNTPNILWTTYDTPTFPQLLLARSVGRTPRLRYLISYYVEVIAPVIIAFDGPSNPFRTQILRMAEESESLQEAIATLSTNNLKRRQEAKTMATERTLPSRMSSFAHRVLTGSTLQDAMSIPGSLAREEQHHRRLAVRALNSDLADPQRRLSDAVLATLLVLCLFHVCDTGIAQFKTQFTGVKKLLAIRIQNSGTASDCLKWFIRLFTWFDTLTASTNNRETELGGTCLDIATSPNEEWGLESVAGCDPSLFKLIARLSRLNLLSRNQAVSVPTPPGFYPPTSVPPVSIVYASLNTGYENMLPTTGPANIYGFSEPIPVPEGPVMEALSPAFWSEWFALRQRLESWHIPRGTETAFVPRDMNDTQVVPPAYISPPLSSDPQLFTIRENFPDIYNISESFRHAAILYCERLAYPSLPSGHPRIQNIVQIAMQHICAVQSDVFLLWPLFITGSECVLEEHRAMIRRRCTDISKDSGFFNNLSCLELLEKVWAQNVETGTASPALDPTRIPQDQIIYLGSKEHGFRWDRVIQSKSADGEYMIV